MRNIASGAPNSIYQKNVTEECYKYKTFSCTILNYTIVSSEAVSFLI